MEKAFTPAYCGSLKAVAQKSNPPPYRVQLALDDPSIFQHHKSVSLLWSTKWRKPCSEGIYPFADGKVEDFDPIFDEIIKTSGDDPKILYDPDAYAKHFLPVGDDLVKRASEAEKNGDTETAKDLFLRAAVVFRIARFPLNRSELTQKAWELGKDAYSRGGKYLDPPLQDVQIAFKHCDKAAGDKETDIPINIRVPKGQKPEGGWPVLLFICGLDAYRTDHTTRVNNHVANGFATMLAEIPGTGDCPGARNDPTSPDRVWSSVLDWVESAASEYGLNPKRVFARGISTGGYYAFRIAHTHANRLCGVIGHGGWSHYAMSPEWLREMNHMEYPYALGDAWFYKFGYKSMQEMIDDNPLPKYSLKDSGILDKPCCRLLVMNGTIDSIFPIEDSILVASRGRAKDVRLFEGKPHMGFPGCEQLPIEWMNEVIAGDEMNVKIYDG